MSTKPATKHAAVTATALPAARGAGQRVAPDLRVARLVAPLRQKVTEVIRQAIHDGHFLPGERLNERELCEMTGVSRASLRESLRQLEAEGYVRTIPNKGATVATVSLAEAREIYQVREILEGLAVANFAREASDIDHRRLAAALADLERLLEAGDAHAQHAAITRYYDIVFEGCANETLAAFLRVIHARIVRLRATTITYPGRIEQTVRELKKLTRAIGKRDGDAAWAASDEHLRRAREVAFKVIQEPAPSRG